MVKGGLTGQIDVTNGEAGDWDLEGGLLVSACREVKEFDVSETAKSDGTEVVGGEG